MDVPDKLECEIKSWNDNELTKGKGTKKEKMLNLVGNKRWESIVTHYCGTWLNWKRLYTKKEEKEDNVTDVIGEHTAVGEAASRLPGKSDTVRLFPRATGGLPYVPGVGVGVSEYKHLRRSKTVQFPVLWRKGMTASTFTPCNNNNSWFSHVLFVPSEIII